MKSRAGVWGPAKGDSRLTYTRLFTCFAAGMSGGRSEIGGGRGFQPHPVYCRVSEDWPLPPLKSRILDPPSTHQMKDETDDRQHENDMNQRTGDVKAKAERPKDDENDTDDCEHKSKVNSASLVRACKEISVTSCGSVVGWVRARY